MPECGLVGVLGWMGDHISVLFCSPRGNKSSEPVIYFMCTEICFVKSLGDWHGLEELYVNQRKTVVSTHSEEVHTVHIS